MEKAVVLALAASFCTAMSSVCQRLGAMTVPGGERFNIRLVTQLLRKPIWLAGIGSMILGFLFQVSALHFGDLALVQPILASELLFVFGYMALFAHRHVRRKDWMAGAAMALGLGLFLFTADPSGGRLHGSTTDWLLAAASSLGLAAVAAGSAYVPLPGGRRPSPGRRAATLGVATGVSWGFVAAVIKNLSAYTGRGPLAIFTNWSPYVLVVVGAASILLSSHALQAGPLAASQPGFTIVDPIVASLLGVFLFKERIHLQPQDLVVEGASVALLVVGAITLSHSRLVHGELPDARGRSEPPERVPREPPPEVDVEAKAVVRVGKHLVEGIDEQGYLLGAGDQRREELDHVHAVAGDLGKDVVMLEERHDEELGKESPPYGFERPPGDPEAP